jgi:hypothetical protein
MSWLCHFLLIFSSSASSYVSSLQVAGIPSMTQDDLKKLKKDKKLVKKLANQYDCFLASSTLIRMIPRLLGPGLNKVRTHQSAAHTACAYHHPHRPRYGAGSGVRGGGTSGIRMRRFEI